MKYSKKKAEDSFVIEAEFLKHKVSANMCTIASTANHSC